ncbi:redoxin domain-containing protein [Aquibacillus sediminis]|uniref:redoxin domain-containing protein n=1 Tax=Aquibacillus sediminis TaxID=2574734 RepID=UPI0011099C09|nr:redoxin domain-containing protein [Aquibacillus sediminis]
MKKSIIVGVVLVGMLAWAIYDVTNQQEATSEFSSRDEVDELEQQASDQGNGENEKKSSETVGLNVGDQAPDFELETLQGESVKLSDYRGERVMINFWATWCPPCRAEMPDMQKFHENKGVEILAVNLTDTEDAVQDVHDFVDDFGLTFSILQDAELDVATTYQIQPIPTSFMIDSNGKIQFVAYGPLNYEQMVQEFETMS